MRINALLDAGLRRHDEIMVAAAIFNKLLRFPMDQAAACAA
jgi:hypothetical protein